MDDTQFDHMERGAHKEKVMKTFFAIFAVVAMVTAIFIGNGHALTVKSTAYGAPEVRVTPDCEQQFNKMDRDSKGYLTSRDFKDSYYGVDGHKGSAPAGKADSAFGTADLDGNGEVTTLEYCAFRAPLR